MESMGKKLFWVINIVLLTTIAFLGTRAVGTWFGAELVGLEIVGDGDAVKRTGNEKPKQLSAAVADDIVKRNIFNSTPPLPEELSEDGDGENEGDEPSETKPIPGPDDECEASPADLKGSVTLVADPEKWSMAVVIASRKERLVKVGDLLEGTQVAAIHQQRVVLLRSGQYECVYIEKKKKDKKGSGNKYRSSKNTPKPRSGASKKGNKAQKIKEGVVKKGAGQYEIDRSMLDEQLEDLTNLSRQARVIPHYVKGKTQGFKIVGVRPNSLYSFLGVRSGDILKSVNGEQISSPTKALEFLEALKTTSQVTIDIERRNQKKTFEYEIK